MQLPAESAFGHTPVLGRAGCFQFLQTSPALVQAPVSIHPRASTARDCGVYEGCAGGRKTTTCQVSTQIHIVHSTPPSSHSAILQRHPPFKHDMQAAIGSLPLVFFIVQVSDWVSSAPCLQVQHGVRQQNEAGCFLASHWCDSRG